jgi:hypothetical protein
MLKANGLTHIIHGVLGFPIPYTDSRKILLFKELMAIDREKLSGLERTSKAY